MTASALPIPRGLARVAAFRGIQAALVPLGVAGYVPFVIRLAVSSRRSGTAATVLASLYTRYMQHRLGTRRDDACERLITAYPGVSPLGLRLETAPTLVAHRRTGYVPPIYRYPYEGQPPARHQPSARTTYYDAAVERYAGAVDQVVSLGAGFDTRAHRYGGATGPRWFEVDAPRTQAFKREVLVRAGIDTTGVTYVPADFMHEDWFENLAGAGFDPRRPSLFLWESVTMYLDRDAVLSTLRRIAGTAPGSVLAFDYMSTSMIESGSPFMRYARAVVRYTGEPLRFGIDTTPPAAGRIAAFLEPCGLRLVEHRTFGAESPGRPAWAGFAIATVEPHLTYASCLASTRVRPGAPR